MSGSFFRDSVHQTVNDCNITCVLCVVLRISSSLVQHDVDTDDATEQHEHLGQTQHPTVTTTTTTIISTNSTTTTPASSSSAAAAGQSGVPARRDHLHSPRTAAAGWWYVC